MIATHLLLTPFLHAAPAGVRGDVVRISDGRSEVYVLPDEFDAMDEAALQELFGEKADHA